MITCRHTPCREPGHLGYYAFCAVHMAMLTPRKRAQVEALRSLNVLEPAARMLSQSVILSCRRYLLMKLDARKGHANG